MQHRHHALRTGRASIPGQIYLITTVTLHRQPLFIEWEPAVAAIRTFTSEDTLKSSTLLCWVLMPDHVHWLIQLGDESLPALIKRIKARTARAINRERQHRGSIWQPAYHDRAIRKEEDIKAVARYIIANPIRAGLTERVGEYPFWDAVWV